MRKLFTKICTCSDIPVVLEVSRLVESTSGGSRTGQIERVVVTPERVGTNR